MTADTRALLAKARTEDEEVAALRAAADRLWPWPSGDADAAIIAQRRAVAYILNGPRAGWLGVPLLAMPEGRPWSISGPIVHRPPARVREPYYHGSVDRPYPYQPSPVPMADGADAWLPSCALMLAVLSALDASKVE